MDEKKLAHLKAKKDKQQKRDDLMLEQFNVITSLRDSVEQQTQKLDKLEYPEPKDIEPALKTLSEDVHTLTEKLIEGFSSMPDIQTNVIEVKEINLPKWLDKAPEAYNDSNVVKELKRSYALLEKLNKAASGQKPSDFIPYRRVVKRGNGLEFDDHVGSGGGGGGGSVPYLDINGNPHAATVVESLDIPGVWGVVILNPDGSSVGTGTTPVTSSHIIGEDGSGLLTEDGNYITLE